MTKTINGHNPEDVSAVKRFIEKTDNHFHLANGKNTREIALRVLDIIDLNSMLSKIYTPEDANVAYATLFALETHMARVQNILFDEEIEVHGKKVYGRTNPILIDGIAYKEYWRKKRNHDKKYTRFVRLLDGELTSGKELESDKNHTFSNDEILDSFIQAMFK